MEPDVRNLDFVAGQGREEVGNAHDRVVYFFDLHRALVGPLVEFIGAVVEGVVVPLSEEVGHGDIRDEVIRRVGSVHRLRLTGGCQGGGYDLRLETVVAHHDEGVTDTRFEIREQPAVAGRVDQVQDGIPSFGCFFIGLFLFAADRGCVVLDHRTDDGSGVREEIRRLLQVVDVALDVLAEHIVFQRFLGGMTLRKVLVGIDETGGQHDGLVLSGFYVAEGDASVVLSGVFTLFILAVGHGHEGVDAGGIQGDFQDFMAGGRVVGEDVFFLVAGDGFRRAAHAVGGQFTGVDGILDAGNVLSEIHFHGQFAFHGIACIEFDAVVGTRIEKVIVLEDHRLVVGTETAQSRNEVGKIQIENARLRVECAGIRGIFREVVIRGRVVILGNLFAGQLIMILVISIHWVRALIIPTDVLLVHRHEVGLEVPLEVEIRPGAVDSAFALDRAAWCHIHFFAFFAPADGAVTDSVDIIIRDGVAMLFSPE